jgi:hypothetical protein
MREEEETMEAGPAPEQRQRSGAGNAVFKTFQTTLTLHINYIITIINLVMVKYNSKLE